MMPPDPVGPTGATSLSKIPVVPISLSCSEEGSRSAGLSSVVGAAFSFSDSISAITPPMGIVSPSTAIISRSVPATGDGSSIATLSVTTSTSGSYFSILSPTATSHFPMMPSVTDSPTWGSSIFKF